MNNYDEKVEALKSLVHEAAMESRESYPNRLKNSFEPAFDAAGFQTYHMDALTSVLSTTDALYVLDEILNDGE